MPERTVGVVGLGLVGGSLARALVTRGVRVVGATRDAADRVAAAQCGVRVLPDARAVAAAAGGGGVVVLGVPLGALAAVAEQVVPALAPGATVLHAAGLQARSATGLDDATWARVVGAHPLAGSHGAGFAASRAGLFAGATVLVEARAAEPVREAAEWVWGEAGAGAVVYADAAAHDRRVAWASHLPQLAAVAVAAALADAGVPAGAGGPGLRDVTRLAASPPALWGDLLGAAPPDTEAALACLAATVDRLRAAVAGGDAATLAEVWGRARAWRRAAGAAPAGAA